ncbi:MAG: hypothetical protein Q9165_001886 [Trypethelium subeluteriae]
MDTTKDTLEDSISDFFSKCGTDATRHQCDRLAISLAGHPIVPVPVQGACSYTVAAGPTQDAIFQFRSLQERPIDPKLLQLVKEIHGDLVPTTIPYGTIGGDSPLQIVLMQKLPGITHLEARFAMTSPIGHSVDQGVVKQNTVTDLAQCFIAELEKAQKLPHAEIRLLRSDMEKKLEVLLRNLPDRFKEIIKDTRNSLDSLFTKWPLTLSHEDLTEMNVLIDPSTGRLTGIIDWNNARIAPFGLGLYGVESFLGTMENDGWKYLNNIEQIRAVFQELLRSALTKNLPDLSEAEAQSKLLLAKRLGFLLHYGFVFGDGEGERPVKEGDRNMLYLKAFLL